MDRKVCKGRWWPCDHQVGWWGEGILAGKVVLRKGKVRGLNPNGDICTNPCGGKGGPGTGTRVRPKGKGL